MTTALGGQRIVVTRTRSQASKLVAALEHHGAHVIEVPTIAIQPPADKGVALQAAANDLSAWSWIVMTSPNGAERFCAAVGSTPLPDDLKLAAVGPATARIIEEHLRPVDLLPTRYVGEGLVAAFPGAGGGERPVLLPQAAVARDTVPVGLGELGWNVTLVEAYETVPAPVTAEQIAQVANADMVTFTSSSTVEQFVALVGAHNVPPQIACIGPITAQTAREIGLSPAIVANEHTIDGLVVAILEAENPHQVP